MNAYENNILLDVLQYRKVKKLNNCPPWREDLLLKYGRFWTPAKFPKDLVPGTIKMCFANSAKLAMRSKRFVYCEGLALGIISVLHAWCIDEVGNVVDPTWTEGHGERSPAGSAYLGLPFNTAYVRKRWKASGGQFSLLDDWEGKKCFRVARELDPASEWFHEGMASKGSLLPASQVALGMAI
jgi:hypothetical protein